MYSQVLSVDLKHTEKPFFISGKVVHSLTKKPLSEASVLIWNTTLKVKTDSEGNFTIEIPVYYQEESAMFEFRLAGMESQIVSLPVNKNTKDIIFYLEPKIKSTGTSVFKQLMKRMKVF